ncbi:GNAT family N-acetyltransferase [Kitasatospora nipponensis]|uniref:GNAT family N-acetyltransferase n=1 Tax=Kitasatospora nipponensis TaxID=258049 RepID=A0ABN1VQY6_9ACTN
MTWTLSDSLEEFRARAADHLAAHPVQNTVLLTIVDRLAAGGPAGGDPALPPLFGWWRPAAGAPVAGAWVQTRPQPVQLSRMPIEAAVELAAVLPAGELSGISGEVATAEAFAAAWSERTGAVTEPHESRRLYRLGELSPPSVAGRLRLAGEDDRELVVRWFTAFAVDAGVRLQGIERIAARRLAAEEMWLWEDGGRAVAMAAASPVLAGMSRIGPVYTPVERRGNGYASAATAGVSQLARERGAAEVLLFTDLANPVSNSIYQKIGYRPVEDGASLDFRY